MEILEIISLVFLGATLVISILSSIADFRSMTIPNWHSGVIILLFIPAYLLAPNLFYPIFHHITAFVVMFIVSFLLFHFKVMGGGDSKLATALSLWLGLKPMMIFMFFMALVGGVLGGITIYIQKKKPFKSYAEESWIYKAQQGVNAVPYAIAITSGYFVSVFHIVLTLTKS